MIKLLIFDMDFLIWIAYITRGYLKELLLFKFIFVKLKKHYKLCIFFNNYFVMNTIFKYEPKNTLNKCRIIQ